jgi:CRP-like cAMP-binding protein
MFSPLSRFKKDEVLCKKGQDVEYFMIIDEGEVSVEDIEVADKIVKNFIVSHGGYVGQHCIVAGNRLQANLVARTDGLAFRIDRDTFKNTIGNLDRLVRRAMDKRILVSVFLYMKKWATVEHSVYHKTPYRI